MGSEIGLKRKTMLRDSVALVLVVHLLGKTVEAGWREDGLKAHNELRAAHGASPLVLDAKLNREAQAYAEKLAKLGYMQHASGISQGENLYMDSKWPAKFGPKGKVAKKAATSWYSEIKDYDFTTTRCSAVCGHFTQLVWKNSKKLGLGLAQVVKGGWAKNFVVARYDPRGNFNMVGQSSGLPGKRGTKSLISRLKTNR